MNIGVNTLFHIPGEVGGTETYLVELLSAIARQHPEHQYTLFTHIGNDQQLKDLLQDFPSIVFKKLPFNASLRPLRIVLEQSLLPVFILSSSLDVLWSPGYTSPIWVSCKQVVTIHDLQYKTHPEDLSWIERVTFDALVRISCRKNKYVIVVSQFSKNELLKFGFSNSKKIEVVYEGVDPSFSFPVKNNYYKLPESIKNIPLDQPFILCVANSYPHKNIDLLIYSFNKILKKIPHNLVIVGKPRRGESAVSAAIECLVEKNRLYRVTERISFDILRLLYQKADLYVFPSSYEGFGLPVLEAMMAGTEVLCSRSGSLPEVGGKYAYYFEKFDADVIALEIMAIIKTEDEIRKKRVKDAKLWAKSFTWGKTAQNTINVLSLKK